MSTAAEDDYESTALATAWIADATRQFAGLSATDPAEDDRWSQTGSALSQLRAGIAQRISVLPRQGKQIRTSQPGITVSHFALAKLLTWALAEPAAAVTAAIADVEVHVGGQRLAAVHIHLIGIGTEERDRTYLQDGDALRREAARVLRAALGEDSAEITASWDDVVVERR